MMRILLPVLSTQTWLLSILATLAVGVVLVAVYQYGRRR